MQMRTGRRWRVSSTKVIRLLINIAGDIDDSRKDKVLKQLLGQAMSLVEGGEGLDPDTMKTVVEVFRKLNILKDDVETEIRPLRFLPERCFQAVVIGFLSKMLSKEVL